MAFRLPIIGYVAFRGVGDDRIVLNKYNFDNKHDVELEIERVRLVYNNNKDSRGFSYDDKLNLAKAFRETFLETDNTNRLELKRILKSLTGGGFIVTPNLHHIIYAEDDTRKIVRKHLEKLTGFLFTDETKDLRIENMKDISALTEMAMINLGSVLKSIPQPTEKNPTKKEFANRTRLFR